MSYKESRELQNLPREIEALEREQTLLVQRMGEPDYHRNGAEQMKADRQRAEAIERELAEKFERWSVLEQKSSTTKAT
jgi:ATP-binding cassette subfamily F protein uup